MKKFQPTLEHAFYLLALTLAFGLRFLHLGSLPLSDFEADWALQALRVTQGLKPAIGPNPAYVHLTAILFYIFRSTNFLARFWPALAGSALILTPGLVRGRIGRIPAIVLALGLAVDPGLVAMSRLGGGPMLAITAVTLTGLLWINGHRSLAGLFAGLALLSGQAAWFGIFDLSLVWAFYTVYSKNSPVDLEEKNASAEKNIPPVHTRWEDMRGTVTWMLGTLLVLGSLVILSPKGLPAIITSFSAFVRGWWVFSDTPVWQSLLALPAYEILPLGFGIAGAVRGIVKRDHISILLGIWALLAFVLELSYSGKQTSDLIWTILPLWALAAIELGHHFDFSSHNLWQVTGLVTLVMALLIFGWLNFASLIKMDMATDMAHMRLTLLMVVVLLVGLSILLVSAGWSAGVARLGGVWAAVFALSLYTFSMSTGAAGIREPLTVELWQPEPRASRVDVLLKVANQISDLNTGYNNQIPLTIQNLDSPSLQWLFRDWQIQNVTALAPDTSPEMVITSVNQVSLAANYRGEALPLSEVADWDHATQSDWLNWFVYRQMPILRKDIILWVRSDLMLDSQGLPATSPNP